MASAYAATVHEEIRRWAEKHDGRPAKVETGVPGGILRLDFGEKDPNLKRSRGTSSSGSSTTTTWRS